MELVNFHVHSTGSDGESSPEEMVLAAIDSGFKTICFTDHYKLPSEFSHEHDHFRSESYIKEVKKLQKKFKGKIEILLGAEFDWIEKFKAWTAEEIKTGDYDFVLGSVHFIFDGDEYIPIDSSREEWVQLAKKLGGEEQLARAYYGQMREMIKSKLFDCVSHFDLVKIYNKDSVLFSEFEPWYKDEVLKTLDIAAKEKICIEINPRGFFRHVGVQYPSEWIMQEANKRGIKITVGNDAHKVSEILDGFPEALDMARKAGYKNVSVFRKRKMSEVEL